MQSTSKKPITIKLIAQDLGVSFSTVSKALNDDPLVSEETKKMIQKRARELNYSPNQFARGLRNKETKTIGIILNDLENPSHMNIVKRISVDLAKYDYTALLFDSQFNPTIERNNIQAVMSRKPDGIILSPVDEDPRNLEPLLPIQDKVIILGQPYAKFDCNYLHTNNFQAGYLSASAVLNRGHFKNLIMVGPESFPATKQFIAGLSKAYSDYCVPLNSDMLIYCIPSLENAFISFTQFYNLNKDTLDKQFTAVISFCDMMACGVYKAAARLGLSITNDISIIGYDDNVLSELLAPALTTIHLPQEQISMYCSEILTSILINEDYRKKVYSFEPYLVERSSLIVNTKGK